MKEYIVPVGDEGNMNMIENELHLQQLIRCRDCKHNMSSPHNPVCELDVYRSGGVDWFCADGEREEGEVNERTVV